MRNASCRLTILGVVGVLVAACSSSGEPQAAGTVATGGGTAAGGSSNGGKGGGAGNAAGKGGGATGGAGGAIVSCSTDADCDKALPPTTPPNCARGTCDSGHTCRFHPHDDDMDGHDAMGCTGTGVAAGDDCNDGDKNFYPGAWDGPKDPANPTLHPDSCNGMDNDCNLKADDATLPDGTSCACTIGGKPADCSVDGTGKTISWPGGKPQGMCAYGKQTCINMNGKGALGPCMGATGPAPRDCASSKDNDCDGTPDNAHDSVCACQPTDSNACMGTNGCPGTRSCQITKQMSSWGACMAPASCACGPSSAGGKTQQPCSTPKSQGGLELSGPCASGTQQCVNGQWSSTCSVAPAMTDTCDKGNDANCNGVANNGCGSCINGEPCPGTGPTGMCSGGTHTGCPSSTCQNAQSYGCPGASCSGTQTGDGNPVGDYDTGCGCPNASGFGAEIGAHWWSKGFPLAGGASSISATIYFGATPSCWDGTNQGMHIVCGVVSGQCPSAGNGIPDADQVYNAYVDQYQLNHKTTAANAIHVSTNMPYCFPDNQGCNGGAAPLTPDKTLCCKFYRGDASWTTCPQTCCTRTIVIDWAYDANPICQ